jgi:hypothetical protein
VDKCWGVSPVCVPLIPEWGQGVEMSRILKAKDPLKGKNLRKRKEKTTGLKVVVALEKILHILFIFTD